LDLGPTGARWAGRDLSIGYHAHTETSIRLYVVESMAVRVLTPEAAVALAHKDEKTRKTR
jgi:uncharacterized linocin/CFP29 family protein